ncbi:MAG: hsp70 family protein [Planctomycetaceae bacterium]|nr:hsp70 family protein [Planctomycetaceae bacterium]
MPQLVAAGLVESRETLPSFHYEPHANELSPEQIRLPFDQSHFPNDVKPGCVVGIYARDFGGKVVGRLVTSAKSWLCHSGVDRTSKLLPWQAADDVTKLSPADVTARYLSHIRAAWDHAFPQYPLAGQDVVITLPASFDEVARELTIRAARAAGIPKIVLLEEPQAAFYAWIDEHTDNWRTLVSPGQKILVCDIGGGTTDLTLIRVCAAAKETHAAAEETCAETDGTVRFHRVAVGDHLILGGDNLDLALAHHLEARLVGQGKLAANLWGLLVRMACDVKETMLGRSTGLLADDAPEKMTVLLPSIGSKLIGGARQIEVTREEVEQLLVDGFMPLVPLDAKPSRHQSGVREFGLPYATDHAITRYLAQFLTTHRHAGSITDDEREHDSQLTEERAILPDLVLLNGGMFEAAKMRRRLLEQLTTWGIQNAERGTPVLLENTRLDLAVARGAAYYGMVRRGFGERINAGLARTYYLGVEFNETDATFGESCLPVNSKLLCLLPAGTEVDHTVTLSDRSFDLLVGEPIQFPVFVSSVRLTDRTGDLLPFDPLEMTALPPIQTVIKRVKGRGARSEGRVDTVTVQLEGKLTEIGTLELWCVECHGKGRWRLDFDVRSVTETDRDAVAAGGDAATAVTERDGIVDEETWLPVREVLAATFADNGTDKTNRLMRRLDEASSLRRDDWPTSLLRRTGDELIGPLFDGRRKSPEHEARWLNLIGYAWRPGYGLSLDDWRIEQLWRKVQGNLAGKTIDCRLQSWILWRRVAGGLSAGQQKTLADPLLGNVRNLHRQATTGLGRGADMDLYSQEGAEIWRLLGSLERLPSEMKVELGDMILDLFRRKKAAPVCTAMIWALGRLGSRALMYGPLNAVISPQTAEQWLRKIIDRSTLANRAMQHAPIIAVAGRSEAPPSVAEQLALMQIARKTGDRYRDIGQSTRDLVLETLENHASPLPKQQHLATLVREVAQLDTDEQGAVFGETLPLGLRLHH